MCRAWPKKKIRTRGQRTDIGKYSFVNRTIQDWNQLPGTVFEQLPCTQMEFKKRARKEILSSIIKQNAGGPGYIIHNFIMFLTKILLLFSVMLVMTRATRQKEDRRNFWRTNRVGRERQILRAMNSTRVMGTISHKRRVVKSKTLIWCCWIDCLVINP